MTLISFEWRVDGALADADAVTFSNAAASFGLRRVDTLETLVAAGVALTRNSLGQYSYTLTDPESGGILYEYYIKVVYDGDVYYIQNFQEQGGILEGTARTFRAIFLDEAGEPLTLDAVPELSSPTGTYGVKRLEDSVTVIPAATAMTEIGDGYFASYFTSDDPSSRFRFYVHAVLNNVSYYLPSVSNGQCYSVALVLGRYTDSYRIGQMVGHDNLALWVGTPQYGTMEADEPVDFARRMSEFIIRAENRLDEELYGVYVAEAFTDPIPQTIRDLATSMAAIAMYESRGVDDVGDAEEGPIHRLSGLKRQVLKDIRRIKLGLIKVADIGYSGPLVGAEDVTADD